MQLTTPYSGCGKIEMDLFDKSQHSWRSCALTHMLSLAPVREITGPEGIELCRLGVGLMWVKPDCSSYPLQCVHIVFSFSSDVLELLCWELGLPERLFHPWVIVLKQCSLGPPGPWPKGTRDRSRPLRGPQPGLRPV